MVLQLFTIYIFVGESPCVLTSSTIFLQLLPVLRHRASPWAVPGVAVARPRAADVPPPPWERRRSGQTVKVIYMDIYIYMTPLPHSQLSFSARTSPRAEGSFERSIVGQALIFNARNTDIRPCRLQRMHYHQPFGGGGDGEACQISWEGTYGHEWQRSALLSQRSTSRKNDPAATLSTVFFGQNQPKGWR